QRGGWCRCRSPPRYRAPYAQKRRDGLRIQRAMIEGAAGGSRYLDYAHCPQRHGDSAPTYAANAIKGRPEIADHTAAPRVLSFLLLAGLLISPIATNMSRHSYWRPRSRQFARMSFNARSFGCNSNP